MKFCAPQPCSHPKLTKFRSVNSFSYSNFSVLQYCSASGGQGPLIIVCASCVLCQSTENMFRPFFQMVSIRVKMQKILAHEELTCNGEDIAMYFITIKTVRSTTMHKRHILRRHKATLSGTGKRLSATVRPPVRGFNGSRHAESDFRPFLK